jgi:BirA family biotin operon repressor/biotin-[acetyl-CoA-carboxylase] ligase
MQTSRGSDGQLISPWPGALVHVRERTLSTMDDALALARDGCPTGTVVIARFQERGRGRVPGRTWLSPPGQSLLATLVLGIRDLGYPLEQLPLRAGIAVALALEDATGISVGIKWPNDVVAGADTPFEGRKLAGLLCEAHGDAALVGFGVNCTQDSFPPEIERTACSILQVSGRTIPLQDLCASILGRLKNAGDLAAWQELLRGRLYRRGQAVRVDLLGSGKVVEGVLRDVDDKGRLVIELSDGRLQAVAQGELLPSP